MLKIAVPDLISNSYFPAIAAVELGFFEREGVAMELKHIFPVSKCCELLRNGEAAPPKADPVPMPELKCEKVDDVYVLRDGASGLFLAASQFPKNRETRAPLVKELLPHKSEIDPKYHFLLDAPVADPDGNPTVVRYSRKTKEQYVMTEEDGKPTGWYAFYRDGAWEVEEKKTAPKKKAAKKKAKEEVDKQLKDGLKKLFN